MSLVVIKAGLLDTVQDSGRTGYRHMGIHPSGAMDTLSARTANALLGKELSAPVIEMHFPAPHFLFKEATLICITGADFQPVLENTPLPLCHPVVVPKGAILRFEKRINGARCYLSVWHDLLLPQWAGSYSTSLKAGAGGVNGRSLITGDVISFSPLQKLPMAILPKEPLILHWTAAFPVLSKQSLCFVVGPEWDWMEKKSRKILEEKEFAITQQADRMGYRLSGTPLRLQEKKSLVSSAVNFGTIQLLPDGQLVVLMADHQTTGGYPRIGNVSATDLPLLAQKNANETIRFVLSDLMTAQRECVALEKNLRLLQYACTEKLKEAFHDHL